MIVQIPAWVQDAVFYQIFPDRFASSAAVDKPANLEPWDARPTTHGFKGGDLAGVTEHLDYLVDLGVNAIYFNPIFQSAANHRYHTHDYYQVDPILGGNEAFHDFLDAAHRRGMRVVLDGVFNHASRGFLQFNHIMENGPRSPYLDWFHIKGFPLRAFDPGAPPNYECWWGLPALPKLNTDNPAVREFIFGVAEHWLRQGIDGWRLDVPLDIQTPGFWATFRRRVKAINPDAYILAEIWHDAQPWLQGEHFDAVMNYGFNRACYGFFGGAWLDTNHQPGGYALEPLDGPAFAEEIERLLGLYASEIVRAQFNLLSSHDEPRFLTMVKGDVRRLRLAILFQMTFSGAPSIYYGDEIGIEGGRDPDCRRAFTWDEWRWDKALLAYVRRAVALRHAHPALRRGTFTPLAVTQDAYAFARVYEDDVVVVAFNRGAEPVHLTLDVSALMPPDTRFKEAWSDRVLRPEAGDLDVTVPPLDACVLVG